MGAKFEGPALKKGTEEELEVTLEKKGGKVDTRKAYKRLSALRIW